MNKSLNIILFLLLLPLFDRYFGESAQADSPKYLGAATCASSNCHGGATPRKSASVLQNEYSTWYKNEAHSQAYATLKKQDSKIIARNLGIGAPEQAKICLDCHATNVPQSAQGLKFRISDGVSCESCHGAAEKYIATHTATGTAHADNVSRGLIDLVSLKARTQVCSKCHVGNENQAVTHRLIGAGHPRLTFELDTYSVLQPNHWEVDEDYVKRKAAYSPARAWLVGQQVRASEMIDILLSKKLSHIGAFPELGLFYCYTCHHSLTEDQWKSRTYGGRPGELRVNVSSVIMLTEAMRVLAPSVASSLDEATRAAIEGFSQGSTEGLINLKRIIDNDVSSAISQAGYGRENALALLKQIVRFGGERPALPYEVAEQCAMAMSALNAAVDSSGKLYQKSIDGVYAALKNEEAFNSDAFNRAVKAFSIR